MSDDDGGPMKTQAFTLLYTDAPEVYDGFGAHTVANVGISRNGNPVRKVLVPDDAYEWLTTRYGSGLYRYTNDRCSLERYVQFNDWTIAADILERETSR